MNELSFLLPHFLKEGRGQARRLLHPRLQPGVDQPRRLLLDRGAHRRGEGRPATWPSRRRGARPPTSPTTCCRWATAPSATTSHSYETHDGQWIGFRQPVLREARRAPGRDGRPTPARPTRARCGRRTSSGSSCRGGSTPTARSASATSSSRRAARARSSRVDEYYGWIFEHSVPGLPGEGGGRGPHAARVHAPLRRLRDHQRTSGRATRRRCPSDRARATPSEDRPRPGLQRRRRGRRRPTSSPCRTAEPDADGRRPRRRAGRRRGPARLPDPVGPARVLLVDAGRLGLAGARRCPATSAATSTPTDLEPGQMPLISTFRLPVQIHTRSANAKWLDEIAHTNPLWLHPDRRRPPRRRDRRPRAGRDRDRPLRVKAWVTEGIRPGVVACSHHMGRWKLGAPVSRGQGQMMATVALDRDGDAVGACGAGPGVAALRVVRPRHPAHLVDRRRRAPEPHLPRPPRPDLRAALLAPGGAGRARPSRATQPATSPSTPTPPTTSTTAGWSSPGGRDLVSPDGTRRPHWLLRPLKPGP